MAEEGKLGLEAPMKPPLVEDLREDSAFETREQRKEILRAIVDVESTGALAPWVHASDSRPVHVLLFVKAQSWLAEEPTSWTEALRKGWFHGEGGSIFDAWLTSSCAQISALPGNHARMPRQGMRATLGKKCFVVAVLRDSCWPSARCPGDL